MLVKLLLKAVLRAGSSRLVVDARALAVKVGLDHSSQHIIATLVCLGGQV